MKDPELVVQYFPDSDTLRLGAGEVPAEGETIAKWLMVEWNHENEVTGVVLRNASKVLRPYLFPDQETQECASGIKQEDSVLLPSSQTTDQSSTDPHP